MKSILIVLVFSLSSTTFASGIVQTLKTVYVSNVDTSSCLAKKTAAPGQSPVKDVAKNHFIILGMTFVRYDYKWPMEISNIRVSVDLPDGARHVCNVAGEELFALRKEWYADKKAILPAEPHRFVADCPLSCGGISMDQAFVAEATVEVFGSTVDTNGKYNEEFMRNVFILRKN